MFGFGRKAEAPVEAKASAAGRVAAWGAVGRNVWSPRDGASLVKNGYGGNPVGFRCVRLIAEAAAAVPLAVHGPDGRLAVHPLLDLIARPNAAQGGAAFREALYGQLLLTGDAYVEGVGVGLPAELHVLRSDRMSVVPGADGWPVAYDYSVGGRKHRFHVGEISPVCHVRAFHPTDDHYGMSPLAAAAGAVDVHNAASRWSKALLDNAARPSGAVINTGEALSNEQFDRLSVELEQHHQGARNAGRPMLLDGGLDWKPMGFSPSDMEFQKTKEAAAREIAMAFGVPPMMLGVPGDATYANYAEANRAFYRLTVLPLVGRVCEALAGWLSVHGGEAVSLAADKDGIPALQAERDGEWRRVAEATFLTDAEKRSMLGLPPLAE
ncbi:phage portal protein [Jannaschia aquimarina]|uniref:Phage portal protein n=1 Tax=Jannaschia aquimarina TaxID=935700 RepID=A0A0D1DBF7_9RHOB|nr:phage portal protein [Jannaschia aquimarina]KIT17283.1 Phage portal protein [Jannaschia aquimarina]SNT19629.1 phage portal protein, HK97 family [Jannaschia aquimarina]